MSGLLTPLTVKGHTLRNRIVMPPMENQKATEGGEVTDALLEHYVRHAQAGVGMVIVEYTYVQPDGRGRLQQLGVHNDAMIPGLKRLVKAVQACGVVIGLQISHGGGKCPSEFAGRTPISASDVVVPGASEQSQGATKDEITGIISSFAQAARRAVEAGFDFIEVHGAHGYLLSEFLSPLTNTRTDEYGGDITARGRFPLTVVHAIRDEIGADVLVLYRLGANDYKEGGLTLDEGKYMARSLVDAGVDLLDISGGLNGASVPGWDEISQGYFVPMAAEIRREVNVPVVVAGGITDPRYADSVIREGKVDLVAVGRALLENPDWPKDAQSVL
ncbi:MAG: NADH:flavin oxidoreductase [Candidatus Latescibacteria bacterium]|jgi:2,4-dienoyl-CoA reductase-like NADH-dependent reductase (Old Yellow Enzyme family)|nr:NADH:flavin oxidoreductase [Candidatus Latescibacterota bacterium]